jgi:hypothetical protein
LEVGYTGTMRGFWCTAISALLHPTRGGDRVAGTAQLRILLN